ncbi:lithostathine-1-beta-like [Hydra vulgaris]|uniref:Lithostathine-1-beta-like n=1 Tax=Hydra vulgaris TaxID=6087 RepID=A0ABM4DCE5_HYDVU
MSKNELVSILSMAVIEVEVTLVVNPKCPSGWSKNAGYCYLYQSSVKTYQDSLFSCQSYEGTLLSVEDQVENTFISNYIISNNLKSTSIWIGLHDNEDLRKFEWSDGTPLSYTNWKIKEPNNLDGNEHCVEISYGGFNDIDCGRSFSFFCELKTMKFNCPDGWSQNAKSQLEKQTGKGRPKKKSCILTSSSVTFQIKKEKAK